MESAADRIGLEPRTYRLMLLETIERRELEVKRRQERREELREEMRWHDNAIAGCAEEIMKLKSKLVSEYAVVAEKEG